MDANSKFQISSQVLTYKVDGSSNLERISISN